MNIAVGSSALTAVRYGLLVPSKAYVGAAQIWPAAGGGGGSGTYRYFKFVPTALRDEPNANSVQLGEFAILNGATRLTGMTASATNNNSPVGEEPDKAIDNNVATKWNSLNKTASALVLTFPTTVTADGYRWATGNDDTERDPVSWSVQGSPDNVAWTTLDTRNSWPGTLARSAYLPDFQFGGAGGGSAGGGQTLGVGGVATPAGAILETGNRGDLVLSGGGSSPSSPKVYDGKGFTCGRVTIPGNNIVVQNYNVRPGSQYGVYITGSGVTVQNCDIKNISVSGDGDLNAFTLLEGSNIKIKYNTAINYVSGDPGSSHTDWIQTWVSSSHPTPVNDVQVIGNKAVGPSNGGRSNSIPSIHQIIMVESAGRGGNSGGSGTPSRWFVAENEFGDSWGQAIKLDAGNNFTFTRNHWVGSSDKVFSFDAGSGNVAYADNVIGSGYGSVGTSLQSGAGPATPL